MSYFELLQRKFTESYKNVIQDDEYYYLYKHLRFDDELRIFGIFDNHKLLYTKPSFFNDPYDCLCLIDYDFSKITKDELIKITGVSMTNKEFKERKDSIIREIKKIPDIMNWGDIGRETFYVTCFNNSPLNILMWSHYTNNHKGFMLEFRFKKIKDVYNNLPMPVFYNDEYPTLNYPFNLTTKHCLDNPEYGSELIIKRLLNKAKVWEYENEFRTMPRIPVSTENSSVLIDFEPSSLTSVILGSKIDATHREKLEVKIKDFSKRNNLEVGIYDSKLSATKYCLEICNHPRLKKSL